MQLQRGRHLCSITSLATIDLFIITKSITLLLLNTALTITMANYPNTTLYNELNVYKHILNYKLYCTGLIYKIHSHFHS